MPKVSVVIPVHNGMKYLPETLDSVIKQTFQDFEVIVVDDGSSDETPNWVASCQDPRVRLVQQPNQGTPGARNNGIANAKGDYIAFLDADDIWKPTKLEKQVRTLNMRPKVGLVYTWMSLIDQDGQSVGRTLSSSIEGYVWPQVVENCRISGGSLHMIRRACFDKVGGFALDLRFAEDWEMLIRLAEHYEFAPVNEPLVLYRQHPNNKSKNCEGMRRDFTVILDRAFAGKSPEFNQLKSRSLGRAHLYLAWKEIENKDPVAAKKFAECALNYHPSFVATWDFWQLNTAILLLQRLGPEGYQKIRSLKNRKHSLQSS